MTTMIKLFFLVSICSCVTSTGAVESSDCGSVPPAPYWEYTTQAGAPAQAVIPEYLWLQDLEWREQMRQWVECEHPGTWVQLSWGESRGNGEIDN